MSLRILACALACAACQVDQAAEVRAYRDVLDRGLPAALPSDTLDARGAMRLANARNETLGLAGEAYVRALVDRRRAASAWLPSIVLSPSWFANDATGAIGGSESGFDVAADLALDVNPKGEAANRRRADVEVERARAALLDAQDALLLDVARTLFEVLRFERSAEVLRASLLVQEARVDDVRARRDVGFARPLDVSLSESIMADARVALLGAESNARNGRALLSFLVGADVGGATLDPSLEVPDAPPPLEELEASALAHRQDVRAAALAVDAALEEARIAAAQWWPSISVDLGVFLTRDSAPTERDWDALIALHLPLFEGGRIRSDVRDALSRLREAGLRKAQVERAARRDVAVALENLLQSGERIAELGVQLSAAREALAQAEGLYDAGLATNLERLTAQDEELQTRLALEDAELERKVFYLDLLRVAGTLHQWVGLERAGDAARGGDDAEAR